MGEATNFTKMRAVGNRKAIDKLTPIRVLVYLGEIITKKKKCVKQLIHVFFDNKKGAEAPNGKQISIIDYNKAKTGFTLASFGKGLSRQVAKE